MKFCKSGVCKQINPQSLTNFNKQKSSKDGLQYNCRTCSSELLDIWNKNNPGRAAKRVSKYRKNNKELCYQRTSDWFKTPEGRLYTKEWRHFNLDKLSAKNNKRHAEKLKRIPKWLTQKDWEKIQEFYTYAQIFSVTLDVPHEVDHIIPLQGKNISGLHCPQNLQILTASENASKGNRF